MHAATSPDIVIGMWTKKRYSSKNVFNPRTKRLGGPLGSSIIVATSISDRVDIMSCLWVGRPCGNIVVTEGNLSTSVREYVRKESYSYLNKSSQPATITVPELEIVSPHHIAPTFSIIHSCDLLLFAVLGTGVSLYPLFSSPIDRVGNCTYIPKEVPVIFPILANTFPDAVNHKVEKFVLEPLPVFIPKPAPKGLGTT